MVTREELLQKVIARNPDLFDDDLRYRRMEKGDKGIFVSIGRSLINIAEELYLTRHYHDYHSYDTRYRLWSAEPKMSTLGHYDWTSNNEIAIVEYEAGEFFSDAESTLVRDIMKREVDSYMSRDSHGYFHRDTKIWKLK